MLVGGLESLCHSLHVLQRLQWSFFASTLDAELGEKVNVVPGSVWTGHVCRGSMSHHTSYLAVEEPVCRNQAFSEM